MNDNFDSNIAKRKPSTKNTRPAHPWDVKNKYDSGTVDKLEEKKPEISKQKQKKSTNILFQKRDRIKILPLQSEQIQSDLSDTININSNYCKLHNDVSDHLFKLLSPSAQSVYLRLYRQSFGWNRNWAAESLPKLTAACNISLQTVRKAIKELETTGCIKKEFSDYHKATVYRVYLPSEIDANINTIADNAGANNRGQNTNIQIVDHKHIHGQENLPTKSGNQIADTDNYDDDDLKNLAEENVFSGGQKINIHSRYSLGTTVYELLKSSGSLPKNIYIYMSNKQLLEAVEIIDEFYDSIGFSIVSRSQYRKSLIDFFEMIKSGFSSDDIRYAVRWTFKNSRSRPESFSLIKHTLHLAMDDLISELKNISGDKELAKKKQEAVKRKKDWGNKDSSQSIAEKDMETWLSVVDDLKENLNEHSFSAFIEPLKLVAVEGEKVVISSPPDSVTWVIDHFVEKIESSYRKKTGKGVAIEVR